MGVVGDERIAPVTYLFGAGQAAEAEQSADEVHATKSAAPSPPGEASPPPQLRPSPVSTSGPKFVDLAELPSAAAEKQRAADKPRGSFDKISNVSMYALARRGMSSREMRDYLLGREFEAPAVDDEIDRLEKVALLDDHALAETLIRTLQSRKGLGRSALTAELRRRNVDQVAIESALTMLDDDDELDRATAIAVKRAGQLHSLDATTAKRRLGDFLLRRGYSGSVVSRAVQHALAPTGPGFR